MDDLRIDCADRESIRACSDLLQASAAACCRRSCDKTCSVSLKLEGSIAWSDIVGILLLDAANL